MCKPQETPHIPGAVFAAVAKDRHGGNPAVQDVYTTRPVARAHVQWYLAHLTELREVFRITAVVETWVVRERFEPPLLPGEDMDDEELLEGPIAWG